MNTYTELSEIFLAARTGVELVVDAKADGKLDLEDLTRNFDKLLQLVTQVRAAIQIDGKLDMASLTQEEIKDLLEYNLTTILLLSGESTDGDGEATYKELADIFNALHDGVLLFEEAAADGKLSLADIPAALDNFIDLGQSVPEAVKIEAKIDISSLTSLQAKALLWQILEDVYTIIDSIKNLQAPEEE